MPLEAALNDYVNEQIEETQDVTPCKGPACNALLYQENELLECQLGAHRVNAGDRSGMTRVDVPQVVERLLGAQFREQNAVGTHPQTALEQLLGRHTRQALIVLAVKEPHVIGMSLENELARILDGYKTLPHRNFPDERLRPGGLSRAGGARDDDVLARPDREAQERLELAGTMQGQEL